MNKLILIITLLLGYSIVTAQSEEKILLNKGIEAYKKGEYTAALDFFNASYTANGAYNKAVFNAANAALLNDSIAIAKDLLAEYISISEDKIDKSQGYYNLGNIQYNEYEELVKDPKESQKSVKVLKESIESFKKAIRNNPKDADARHNLSLAMSKVPPPNENQDNQDNQENQDQEDQNEEQENKEDQENQENQENKDGEGKDGDKKDGEEGDKGEDGDKKEQEEKGDQEKEGDEAGDKGDEEKEGDQKGNQGKEGEEQPEEEMKGKISRMQATKDLDAMNNDEQKTLMKVNRKKGDDKKQNNTSKDW